MFETEIANVENYYADLLIIQYRNKTKARQTIKLGVDLYLGDELLFDLSNVLDIDTAVGAQLDIIGKILGVNRQINGLTIDKEFFSFEKNPLYMASVETYADLLAYDTTDVQEGDIIRVESDTNYDDNTTFYEWVITEGVGAWEYKAANNEISYGYSDVNGLSQGLWKSYNNSIGSAFALQDNDYRLLLKFKALYNVRYGSMACMDSLYYKAFGDDVKYINNKDGSITYKIKSNITVAAQAAVFLGYIVPPLGINYSIDNV